MNINEHHRFSLCLPIVVYIFYRLFLGMNPSEHGIYPAMFLEPLNTMLCMSTCVGEVRA